MNLTLEFRNGMAKVILRPDDDWEQKILGAVAKDSGSLAASVKYKSRSHFDNNPEVVEILLTAGDNEKE